jgi:alcohol dehydrogenase YqhD (iron-dependent ADH family)
MKDFTYYAPTRVIFGRDAETKAGEATAALGCKKVLVHYGSKSAERSGLLGRVCESLKAKGISCVCLGGVVPNPRLSKVREGLDLARKEGVDFILAVGGGSVIDSAKAIAYGLADGERGDVWDFFVRKREPRACAPIGCVLTISAAGSEMSNSAVITNEDGWHKRGYMNDLCRLKFAVLNPALTFTLPVYQVMCGCVDIIMHTLERWFDPERTSAELTDALSAELIKTVMKNALILKDDASNYNAAAEVMWAGSLAHNGLLQAGGSFGDWATHQIEHELSGMFDVAHGAGLAAVWASWARFVYKSALPRFAALGKGVFGADDPVAAIDKMEAFFKSLDMPIRISGLGIDLSQAQIEELAYKCTFARTRKVGLVMPLGEEELRRIYEAAR